MTNTLVVFYSLDGDVRYLAHALAREMSLDLMELELVKPHPTRGFMKYFVGGFLAATGAAPPLRPLAHDAAHYDMVFVGTPVWNRHPAPAVRCALPVPRPRAPFIKLNGALNEHIFVALK